MKVQLPTLELSPDLEAIHRNRDLVRDAIAAYRGAIKALEGLANANHAMCQHQNKRPDYDPGYAGGGMCGYDCPDCGASGWL